MTDQPREERLVVLGRRERHIVVDLADAFVAEELGRENVGRREVLLLRSRDIATHESGEVSEKARQSSLERLADSLWTNRKVSAVVLVKDASKHRRRIKVRQAQLGDRSRDRDQCRGSPAKSD